MSEFIKDLDKFKEIFCGFTKIEMETLNSFLENKNVSTIFSQATSLTQDKEILERIYALRDLKNTYNNLKNYDKEYRINAPDKMHDFMKNKLSDHNDREYFCVAYLDTKLNVIDYEVEFKGTTNSAPVYPREIMKNALLKNANSILLSHNHPSANTTPSTDDIRLTEGFIKISKSLGINILDHIIVGGDSFHSMKERDTVDFNGNFIREEVENYEVKESAEALKQNDKLPFSPSQEQEEVLNALYSAIVTRLKNPNDKELQNDISEKLKDYAKKLDSLHVPFAVQNQVAASAENPSNWERYNNEVLNEVYNLSYKAQTFVRSDSENLTIAGHKGTWYTIGSETIEGTEYFLLEHEAYGEDAASIIVDVTGKAILEDVYNGFDDLREYFESGISLEGAKDFVSSQIELYHSNEEIDDNQKDILSENLENISQGMLNFYYFNWGNIELDKELDHLDKLFNEVLEKNVRETLIELMEYDFEVFEKLVEENSALKPSFENTRSYDDIYKELHENLNNSYRPLYNQLYTSIMQDRKNNEERSDNMPQKEEENIVQSEKDLSATDKLKNTLSEGIKATMESDNFKNWLKTGGKLFYNNYSFNNAMLVYLQKQDASYVMGYETWKDFGRNVAQGANGIKILMPSMAKEKVKGGLAKMIKNSLSYQLEKNSSLEQSVFRLGSTGLEFTMNRSGLIGRRIRGVERGIFESEEVFKKFIDRSILGKVPMHYFVGTVFDAKDVIIPEFLWVKKGYEKSELVKDENNKPIKNKKGEYKIYNTPERQARFNPNLNTFIVAQDPDKMKKLLEVCIAVSEKNGVPVYMKNKENDKNLKGGASGYYSREFSTENPNGFIVLDEKIEPTELCSVMFHEMGHADLHKNLDDLANKMGVEKVTQGMREIQAEAVAYMTASTFGIETETSSFSYLAAYTAGFELQDFQKSIEVIYSECQQLIKDIKTELDIKNLNLDLTEKEAQPLEKESIDNLSQKFISFALDKEDIVYGALEELPSLVSQNKDNIEIIDVLKEQKKNIDLQKDDIEIIKENVEMLSQATDRAMQDNCIENLNSAKNRIDGNVAALEILNERFVYINEQSKGGLKVDFDKNPVKTLNEMKENYPKLNDLSDAQIKYIATSKFISREHGKLLRSNPQKFIDIAVERAEKIDSIISKNGTFVEVARCEKWGEKPIVENGTLCHPKIANDIVKQGEIQIQKLKEHASSQGEYYPFTKCSMTVFSMSEAKELHSIDTGIDLGTGEQKNLLDHMKNECVNSKEREEIFNNLEKSTKERGTKEKIYIPDKAVVDFKDNVVPINKEMNKSQSNWKSEIVAERVAEKIATGLKLAEEKEKSSHVKEK